MNKPYDMNNTIVYLNSFIDSYKNHIIHLEEQKEHLAELMSDIQEHLNQMLSVLPNVSFDNMNDFEAVIASVEELRKNGESLAKERAKIEGIYNEISSVGSCDFEEAVYGGIKKGIESLNARIQQNDTFISNIVSKFEKVKILKVICPSCKVDLNSISKGNNIGDEKCTLCSGHGIVELQQAITHISPNSYLSTSLNNNNAVPLKVAPAQNVKNSFVEEEKTGPSLRDYKRAQHA